MDPKALGGPAKQTGSSQLVKMMGLHCDDGQTQMKDSRIHLALLHIQGPFRFTVKEGKVVCSLVGVSRQE